jgi:3',5'-cyclic AMP phosphodiesterase CpdA
MPTAAPPPPPPTPTGEGSEPVVGPPSPLVFAVAGDNRDGDEVYKRLLDQVVADGNVFLINTGDLVGYGSTKNFEAFQALMDGFGLPFYTTPGNHDRDDDGTFDNYIKFTGAPAMDYSFDVENVHFTMLSSATALLNEDKLDWLDADLSSTDQPVKIVSTHYPPFDPDGSAHTLLSGSDAFMDLMAKHEVAYVFAGHIHAYSEEERDGTVYVISGGAGSPLYEEDHPNAFYHYVQVTIAGTEISTRVVRIE